MSNAPTLQVPSADADTLSVVDTCDVEIVIPVYNEERSLTSCIEGLTSYLTESRFPFSYRITIADNASTDQTWTVAKQLSKRENVQAMHIDAKGRGRALKQAWLNSNASVLVYMDVDLSTGLNGLLPLVSPLMSGHSDIAIGSRLAHGSHVVRGPKREVISRGYNVILRTSLQVHFKDAQCGFKAIRKDCARALLPLVEDDTWFFDTEMLVLAERARLRIHEIPVDWVDDPDSRVDIVHTATDDLKGVARLMRAIPSERVPLANVRAALGRTHANGQSSGLRQLMTFGAVGVTSTLAYMILFAFLRDPVGSQLANLIALCATTAYNTAANRRFTFRVGKVHKPLQMHLEGYVVFLLALGLTSGTLALLNAGGASRSTALELAATTFANALSTLLRFTMFKFWIFRKGRHDSDRSENQNKASEQFTSNSTDNSGAI